MSNVTSHNIRLRAVRDADWPSILAIANQSVADVRGAGTQEEWLGNRKKFDDTKGLREHFVAEESGEIVGYGSIESAANAGEFRMFIVTAPKNLSSVGDLLYRYASEALSKAGARLVRLREYANDRTLREFAEARGFVERERFYIEDAIEIITLIKHLND